MSDRCPACQAWFPGKFHKCKPVYLVAIVSGTEVPDADDYSEHRGFDTEEAAAVAAEEYDSNGDYDIVRQGEGGDFIAWVKASADAEPELFSVFGESVPQYHAREYKPK